MNLNFFGLRQTPFGDTDSLSMFWTAKRQDLATLFRRALVERQGMLVLTGEEGSGKTTFVRAVLDGLAAQKLKVISVSSEKLSFPMLLKTVICELGRTVEQQNPLPNASTTPEKPAHPMAPLEEIAPLMRALHEALLTNQTQQGGAVVLVIDKAHHLPVKAIEDFHWLSYSKPRKGNSYRRSSSAMPHFRLNSKCRNCSYSSSESPYMVSSRHCHSKRVLSTSSRGYEQNMGHVLHLPYFRLKLFVSWPVTEKETHSTSIPLQMLLYGQELTRRQKPISGPLMLEVIGEFRTLPMMNRPVARIQLTRPPIPPRRAVLTTELTAALGS